MKKALIFFIAAVATVHACNKSTYIDGTYAAKFDAIDSHGWLAFVEFTLTEDVISNVEFDCLNREGKRMSENASHQLLMNAILGFGPLEFIPAIEANITAASIIPEFYSIDVIAGATITCTSANVLMTEALDAASDGETNDIIVIQPDPWEDK